MTKVYIVVGLGFGDEGKGLVTDYLCTQSTEPICIRFNGGQQAGHTVAYDNGSHHVYSSFGAGTLRGIPTYWSKYCTFSPIYFYEELKELSIQPIYYLDAESPVTTHYDVLYNRVLEDELGSRRLGSSGMGHSTTIQRAIVDKVYLTVNDIFHGNNLEEKLHEIRSYYEKKFAANIRIQFDQFNHYKEDSLFHSCVEKIKEMHAIETLKTTEQRSRMFQQYSTYIFEGAQGILLDREFGTRPHVTQSNTTSRNALEILENNFPSEVLDIEVIYVTRAYITRHGRGPFLECKPESIFVKKCDELASFNQFQGTFKIGYLDVDLINYSIRCDEKYSSNKCKRSLAITCLDHVDQKRLPLLSKGELRYIDYRELPRLIESDFKSIRYSFGKFSKDMESG